MLAPSDARDASTSDLIRCQVRTVGEGPQAFPLVIEVRIRVTTAHAVMSRDIVDRRTYAQ